MAYTSKPNTGALFTNEKTQGKQPDLTGSININGVEYPLAGWERTSSNGRRFFRLTTKVNTETSDQPPQAA